MEALEAVSEGLVELAVALGAVVMEQAGFEGALARIRLPARCS